MENSPKYQQLADILREEISSTKFSHLNKLSTENELANQYNISRQTVRQAIGLLEKENMVIRRKGSGTYINKPEKNRIKTMSVGVISTYITEYIFPSIVSGIESVLTENGYSLLLSATRNRVDNERKLLIDYIQKNVDGMIIEGTKTTLPNPNLSLYKEIKKLSIPIVFINGYYPELTNSTYVVMDDYNGGLEAVNYLTKHGHTKIAGIFKSDDMQGHRRYAGFIQGLIDVDIQIIDDMIIWYTTETSDSIFGDNVSTELFNVLNNSTAIVCYNDLIAVKLIDLIKKMGKEVPEDITIVSFDNSHYSNLGIMKIVSLNHPKEELGKLAAEKLLSMINGKHEEPLMLSWEIED